MPSTEEISLNSYVDSTQAVRPVLTQQITRIDLPFGNIFGLMGKGLVALLIWSAILSVPVAMFLMFIGAIMAS